MCLCFYNISPSSATWYFHPAQQVRGFREKCKWDLNGLHWCYIIVSPSTPNGLKKQMDWLTCGPVGRSLRRRLIYIQRPTFFFNLSSSSPALPEPPAPAFDVQRCCFALLSEMLPRWWAGHPSTPHLLLFSAECRPTPHPNQSSFPLLSICDSTTASSPSPGRSSLGPRSRPPPRCARCGVVNKWQTSEEECTWEPDG